MRIWFKEFKDNHLLQDLVIENNDPELTRTKKIFSALDEACHSLDLAVPIWLDGTIRDFQKRARARFTQDNFPETIEFDYLEIHVLEE